MSWWWGFPLLAIAAAGWWLQPAKTDTGRTGVFDRLVFPIETNRLAPPAGSSILGSSVVLSNDGRIARTISFGVVVRSDDLGAVWYRETFLPEPNRVSRLVAVAQSADGRRAIAVGWEGLIATTADDGVRWVERPSGGNWDFTHVVMSADGMRAIASSRTHGVLLRTEDGGITWKSETSLQGDVSLAADGLTGLLSGPTLQRTTDGGATWTDVTAQLGPGARLERAAVAADGRHALAVLRDNSIVRSTDGGATWGSRTARPGGSYIRGIALSADGSRTIISDRGTLMTFDSGASWVPVANDARSHGAGLSADGSKAIILLADKGPIHSRDGGKSWQQMAPPAKQPAIWAIAAGVAGIGLLLVSAWQRWRLPGRGWTGRHDIGARAGPGATARPLRRGWVFLLFTGAAAGGWLQPAALEKSTTSLIDRFRSPIKTIGFHHDDWYFNSVVLSADGRIARAAARDVVMRSNDSGLSWYVETSIADPRLRAIGQSADARRAIAVGQGGLVLVTADAGATWAERPLPTRWNLDSVAVSADGMLAIASAYDGRATVRSADGGQSWSVLAAAPIGQVTLAGDGRIGLIANSAGLWRTVDGGTTWSDVWPQGTKRESDLKVALSADGRQALVLAISGQVHHSADGGATWRSLPQVTSFGRAAWSADGSRVIITGFRDMQVSADAGATWSSVPNTDESRSAALSADGTTAVVMLAGDVPVMSTIDGGRHWRRMEPTRTPAGWTVAAVLAGVALLLVPAWRRWRQPVGRRAAAST